MVSPGSPGPPGAARTAGAAEPPGAVRHSASVRTSLASARPPALRAARRANRSWSRRDATTRRWVPRRVNSPGPRPPTTRAATNSASTSTTSTDAVPKPRAIMAGCGDCTNSKAASGSDTIGLWNGW